MGIHRVILKSEFIVLPPIYWGFLFNPNRKVMETHQKPGYTFHPSFH